MRNHNLIENFIFHYLAERDYSARSDLVNESILSGLSYRLLSKCRHFSTYTIACYCRTANGHVQDIATILPDANDNCQGPAVQRMLDAYDTSVLCVILRTWSK